LFHFYINIRFLLKNFVFFRQIYFEFFDFDLFGFNFTLKLSIFMFELLIILLLFNAIISSYRKAYLGIGGRLFCSLILLLLWWVDKLLDFFCFSLYFWIFILLYGFFAELIMSLFRVFGRFNKFRETLLRNFIF